LNDGENRLFLALVLVHLIPLWAFGYFPSQDGPAHLGNAAIIRDYHDPASTAFRAYYVFNQRFTPNWAGHLVLAGLMSLMPPGIAEKAFVSGYVILLPVAIRYAVLAARPDAGFLAVLGFPFVYNYLLHMGFYTFSYSLAMFFFVTGYWLRHRERCGVREMVVLAILSILLYFCHIVSAVAVLLELLVMAVWLLLPEFVGMVHRRRFDPGALRSALPALRPLGGLVPALLLAGLFLVQSTQRHVSWEDKPPLKTVVADLLSLHALVSYEQREVWIARAVAGLFLAIIVYLLLSGRLARQLTFWNGFALVAVVYALVVLVGPSSIGAGSYIHDRMNLYPFLVLIIWFAGHSYGRIARRSIQTLAVGMAGVLLVLHSLKYAELSDYISEYLSGSSYIEPNTTLLPISFSQRGDVAGPGPLSSRIDVFLNVAGRIAAERHVVDLGNYEAAQTPFFPIRFRPGLNPAEQLHYAPVDSASGDITAVPTDLLSYPQRTGGRIDYVLVWGLRAQDRSLAIPRRILGQLEESYTLIYSSPQRGLMQLYRRKDLAIDRRGPRPVSLPPRPTEDQAAVSFHDPSHSGPSGP
jgi:hypothetical protein